MARLEQLETMIERALAEMLHELKDPRIPLVVTVERVRLSSDLSHARVFISTLGDIDALLEALEHARGFLQRRLAHELNLRRTPQLSFQSALFNLDQ